MNFLFSLNQWIIELDLAVSRVSSLCDPSDQQCPSLKANLDLVLNFIIGQEQLLSVSI